VSLSFSVDWPFPRRQHSGKLLNSYSSDQWFEACRLKKELDKKSLSPDIIHKGSFTLAKFVSETVSDSDMKQYLPWPPWAMRQEIETILSVSRRSKVAKASK
jgi:hypothetical protein